MGLFDKFKKKNELEEQYTLDSAEEQELDAVVEENAEENTEEELPTFKVDFTSKDAIESRLKEIYNMDKLYVVLSADVADMQRGLSVPMVLMTKTEKSENRLILIFTDYGKAKKYVGTIRKTTVEDIYPIAEISKQNKIHNLDVICANAAAVGVNAIDFDVDDENGFGCKLDYFMKVNQMSAEGQILFTEAEVEKIKANDGKFIPRFNAMQIIDFNNPYIITRERAEELVNNVMGDDGIKWAEENAKLNELCYAANNLMHKAADDENANGDGSELAEQCKALVVQLNELIFTRLSKLKTWYTLVNAENGEIYTQKGAVYIVYTSLYANRMPKGTKLAEVHPSVAELAYLVGNRPVNIVAVTDGPSIMHIMDRDVFGF
jgi:hypothetical protein